MFKCLIFITVSFLFVVGCGDDNKNGEKTDDSDVAVVDLDLVDEEDEEDTDGTVDEISDEVADEITDLVDTEDEMNTDENPDESADETEDLIDEEDTDETVDESSDEVADETVDETPDDDIDNGPEVPLAGFGDISGECGFLDTELTDAGAHYFKNNIDFATDPYDSEDYQYLTLGGKEIYDDGNLGGSSIYSEMFAYEVLYRCELANLLKTEGEIVYQNSGGKKTDILVEIDSVKIGVSVTRALKYPFDAEYTVADAEDLLDGKLSDILLSSANVASEDSWQKQILHVIAYSDQHAQSLLTAYNSLDSAVKADTVVIVTVSDGDDGFLY